MSSVSPISQMRIQFFEGLAHMKTGVRSLQGKGAGMAGFHRFLERVYSSSRVILFGSFWPWHASPSFNQGSLLML